MRPGRRLRRAAPPTRPGRSLARTVLLVVLLAGLLGGVLGADIAHAVEAPTPVPGTTGGPAGILADIAGHAEPERVDLLGSLLEADDVRWGNYDLGASVSALEHLFSHQARLIFSVGVWAVALGSWGLEFVLGFQLGGLLADDVGVLSGAYARMVTGGPGGIPLRELVLLIAVAHAGWQVFRHRAHAAGAELLVALALALVGGFLLHDVDRAGCEGLSLMRDLTVGTMALGAADADAPLSRTDLCDPAAEAPSVRPVLQDGLQQAFLHEPFLLLQWGVVPEPGTPCRQVADALVAARPWGDDDAPREWMGAAGCPDLAAFNAELSIDRVAGAAAYAAAAVAFTVAVLLTAGTLLAAQVAGALLVLTLPFAVVLAIAPGTGRDMAARWAHGVLKVGVLFVGSGFFLSILTTSLRAVQAGTEGRSVFVRMLTSTILAWTLVLLRGRLLKGLRTAAHGIASRTTRADVGPVGRGVGQTAVGTAVRAAETAGHLHAGALATRAAAGVAGSAASAAVGAAGGAVALAGRAGGAVIDGAGGLARAGAAAVARRTSAGGSGGAG